MEPDERAYLTSMWRDEGACQLDASGDVTPKLRRFPGQPGLPKLTELGTFSVPERPRCGRGLRPLGGATGKDTARYYSGQTGRVELCAGLVAQRPLEHKLRPRDRHWAGLERVLHRNDPPRRDHRHRRRCRADGHRRRPDLTGSSLEPQQTLLVTLSPGRRREWTCSFQAFGALDRPRGVVRRSRPPCPCCRKRLQAVSRATRSGRDPARVGRIDSGSHPDLALAHR